MALGGGLVQTSWGWLSTEVDVKFCCCFISQARVSAPARFLASDGDHPVFSHFHGVEGEHAQHGWLEDSSERGVRLRHLTFGEWMDLARDHARLRKAHLFTDATGHASPEQMARRLARLQDASELPRSVRIGGVLGASRHFPELDITAAPRLDLSIDADPAHVAEMIDAGLRPKTRPEQRVALAVHATRDPWVIMNDGSHPPERWAGELECLADLVEMGFTREASEMAHHMELTSKKGLTNT